MASTFFFILALFITAGSLRLSIGNVHNPGPGFFPLFLGLSMATLSIVSFIRPEGQVKGIAFRRGWRSGKVTFSIYAVLIAYLFLFKILGFYVSTFLLLGCLMKFSGEKGYKRTFLISVLTLMVVYAVFRKFLVIPFPKGMLGI